MKSSIAGKTLAIAGAIAICAVSGVGATPRSFGPVAFLTGPQEGEALDIALTYLERHRDELGLTAADLSERIVQDHYRTRHNGTTHIYLRQRLDGIEVWNGDLNVNVARDGSIINLASRFVADLAAKVNARSPILSDAAAIVAAAEHFGLSPEAGGPILLRSEGTPDRRATFSSAGLSLRDIPIRLTYFPRSDGSVRLAWQVVLDLIESPDWWQVQIDATTGEVLFQHNFTNYDSYQVIPFPPFEHPEDSGGQIVLDDPADLVASPFAWHDTDGAAGGEFTDTRGNNVDAHSDLDANNIPEIRPDGDMGGAMLEFLFDFDPNLPPDAGTNLEAAIVNLFYANNVMHDLTYRYGFDEAAGNFQENNYGNGGAGGDPVQADAQDGSGCNNANFSTPGDGFDPRMQMFIWQGIPNALLTINSPGGIAGDYAAAKGCWGGALEPPTTADIELVDDGGANPTQGCNALINFTPGNIALIDRGTCEFGAKAVNAQNAMASGVVIVNDQQLPNGIISMGAGAVGGSVTIPSVMIGNADGNLIKGVLPAAVNGTVGPDPDNVDRDSDFDNGVIAHEYGHGISNRLTGGPNNTGCLFGSEQAGEGWSDFWAVLLTAKPEHTPLTTRGVGNYLIFQPPTGSGIRNFPYTTDLSVNPQTYADISTTNVPHGVGEIWMAMVWEMYWELVLKHGFDEDFYTGDGGNNLTIQLVIDGMKLQGCGPTFVAARDAILLADVNNNGGANQCEIWRGFAKRGLGVNAVAGGTGVGDEVEDFTVPANCCSQAFCVFFDGFESGDTSAW